jgi:hypothetical protein
MYVNKAQVTINQYNATISVHGITGNQSSNLVDFGKILKNKTFLKIILFTDKTILFKTILEFFQNWWPVMKYNYIYMYFDLNFNADSFLVYMYLSYIAF